MNQGTKASGQEFADSVASSISGNAPTHAPFDLVIDRSPSRLAEASRDFGRLLSGRAEGVIAVKSADELLSTVRHANTSGLTLTPCGTRASCGGQSLPNGGLSLEMTSLTGVGAVDVGSSTIECESGASLRSIIAATLPHQLLPNLLSFNLDLTVGGVLSAGGFGANCHRFGPMVSNVEALEVVTGAGQRVRCSREREPELFHAVLGGLGRCAVISRATLKLRRVQPKVRVWTLLYHRYEDWLDDQVRLTQSDQCDYMQGLFWAGPQVLRPTSEGFSPQAQWLYGLSLGIEYSGEPPDGNRLLSELHCSGVLTVDDADTPEFIDLYRDRFAEMRRSRAWEQRHPWVDCLLSPKMVRDVLPKVLEMLPRAAGDGHRLAWFPTANLPGLFSVPSGDWAVAFAVLPTHIAESEYEDTLAALDEVRRMLWAAGGKAYLIGWFGPMDEAGWRRHYGQRYDAWCAAKRKYDPRGVLHSMAFGK